MTTQISYEGAYGLEHIEEQIQKAWKLNASPTKIVMTFDDWLRLFPDAEEPDDMPTLFGYPLEVAEDSPANTFYIHLTDYNGQ